MESVAFDVSLDTFEDQDLLFHALENIEESNEDHSDLTDCFIADNDFDSSPSPFPSSNHNDSSEDDHLNSDTSDSLNLDLSSLLSPLISHESLPHSSNTNVPLSSDNLNSQYDHSPIHPNHTVPVPIPSQTHDYHPHPSIRNAHNTNDLYSFHPIQTPIHTTVNVANNIPTHSRNSAYPHYSNLNSNVAHYPSHPQSIPYDVHPIHSTHAPSYSQTHSIHHPHTSHRNTYFTDPYFTQSSQYPARPIAFTANPHPSHSKIHYSHAPNCTHSQTRSIHAPNHVHRQNAQIDVNFAEIDGSVNFHVNEATFTPADFPNTQCSHPNFISGNSFNGNPNVDGTTTGDNTSGDGISAPKPVTRAAYKKKKGMTSQMSRVFPDILPVDNTRLTSQNTGKDQLWFFILKLLGDAANKSTIVWTGCQRYFRVKDTGELCKLWSKHNGRTSDVKWETLQRTMRSCALNGIFMAVPSKNHKGTNEEGFFAYVIEPAFYLCMTQEELDQFIRANCEANDISHRYAPY